MRGDVPSLPQYAFMAWCSVKDRDFKISVIKIHNCNLYGTVLISKQTNKQTKKENILHKSCRI